MKLSKAGIDLIKHFEGFRLKPYYDSVGRATVGYGSTAIAQHLMDAGIELTEQQAEKLLLFDLAEAEEAVTKFVKVTLTQNQFDALVSFTFNLGGGNLSKSTLLKLLNQANYSAAAEEFGKWCKAGGKTLPGLVRRRAAERALFLGQNWREFAK